MTDGQLGHAHRLPRPLLVTLIIICAGLVVSILLVSTLAVQAQHQADMTDQRLERLEGFVAERGEVRDNQYRTLDERITATICDLLDHLPASPILDPLRADYGCGPGLPPEAVQQLRTAADETEAAPPKPAVKPARPSPETTDAPTPTPTVAAPPVAPDEPTPVPPAPATPTTAPPPVDLAPITDRICNRLGVCL